MSLKSLKAAAIVLAGLAVAIPTAHAALENINFPAMLQAQVDRQINAVIDAARNQGFTLVLANRRGALTPGSNSSFTVRLQRGVEYRLAARCGSDCPDVDLVLRDANGRELRGGRGTDDAPSFSFTPSYSGTYTVAVGMQQCNARRCQVGAVVMSRG